ncbi:hypothetical protein BABINDRAFT_120070 [Babjeviella inositovora NRRL Y-12698]|uniref:Uncharacterized protein n=1 Tax=Babjeviella inositovora NRRL Y-12698 TaxID=984486 RepID=A0A1E3QVK3_9ASCO|nr:uncharacterized protein BABINDRAFT_120070 [Babjeviella inositovora NRRL Y-12698]ODQ81102.1 hypothetical protein BABINDRAFT_120070 [Babjeviella inositovora NRRL Y-12698]
MGLVTNSSVCPGYPAYKNSFSRVASAPRISWRVPRLRGTRLSQRRCAIADTMAGKSCPQDNLLSSCTSATLLLKTFHSRVLPVCRCPFSVPTLAQYSLLSRTNGHNCYYLQEACQPGGCCYNG